MTDKELDDLFTKAFSNHEAPVPDDMWQRVQPQKRKRRGAIIWWSATGIAIAVTLSATIWIYQHHFSLKNNTTASSHTQKNKEKKERNIRPSRQSISSVKKENTDNYTDSDLLVNNTQTALKNRNNRFAYLNHSKYKKNKSEIINPPTYETTGKQRLDVNKLNGQTDVIADNKVNQSTEANKQNNTSDVKPNAPAINNPDSIETAIENKNTKSTTLMANNASTLLKINKKDTKEKTEIEFMIAGYVSNRHVYDLNKDILVPYFVPGAVNPETKTSVGSFSINMRLTKPITKNLFIKTGLQFLQTRQSIIYTQQSVTRNAFVSTLSNNMADTMRYSQISLQRPLAKSVYNSISVPLLIGYQTSGTKINFGASAGAVINLVSWYRGDVPDGDYSKMIKAGSTFKQNNGVALYAGLLIGKEFGNWQLFAEPHLQHTLSSITKSSASFRQKINSYGVGIGVKKKIGK